MSLASDLARGMLAGVLSLVVTTATASMEPLADAELTEVSGQAGSLFVADRIAANELTGALGAGSSTDFTYYRMGMDVKMDMNINIAKFQAGCGGVNDFLTGSTAGGSICDLDLDYVGFMGLNAAGDRPATNGPDSLFTLTRPYMEIAIKNDGTANREVVGIKIGAQKINGAIRIGRDYTGVGGFGQEASLTNAEWGGVCNPSATTDSGMNNCHSGITSLSGYLAGIELSAGFLAQAKIKDALILFGIPTITVNIDGCVGRINFAGCTTNDTPFFIDAGGTRVTNLWAAAASLTLTADVVIPITLSGYGQLNLGMRPIHYLLAPNASDFFLSFQRQPVSWPRYEKAPPTYAPGAFDSCNPTWGQIPTNGRCSSAYSEPANTGWWLTATNIKMLNLVPTQRIILPGTLTLGGLLGALGENSNILINNPKLDFVAARNCYGTRIFC